MIFRKARLEDAEAIAPLLMLASGEVIYKFIGEENYERALDFLLRYVTSEGNQYSYQHCYVATEEAEILVAALVYDGAKLEELRKPVLEYVHQHFDTALTIEDETHAGEFYLDSFGVAPSQQGKGIGSKMLSFLIQEIVHKQGKTLGLLVDKTNPAAQKLYAKLGFEYVEDKELLGFAMEHLQVKAH
jgi:ribosomal protein S18 acetylase RimI-like enzyme